MTFRAAKIGANTLEFLAALVAFILSRFHAAFKLYSKRISYATHIASLLFDFTC